MREFSYTVVKRCDVESRSVGSYDFKWSLATPQDIREASSNRVCLFPGDTVKYTAHREAEYFNEEDLIRTRPCLKHALESGSLVRQTPKVSGQTTGQNIPFEESIRLKFLADRDREVQYAESELRSVLAELRKENEELRSALAIATEPAKTTDYLGIQGVMCLAALSLFAKESIPKTRLKVAPHPVSSTLEAIDETADNITRLEKKKS